METSQTDLVAKSVTLVRKPIVVVLAEMALRHDGVRQMAEWVKKTRPECLPGDVTDNVLDLLPHDGREELPDGSTHVVTDNELLAEIAGRKCYDSFAEKAAFRSNGQYLSSMWLNRVPHRSTGYHPKMTFFFANVSRRVSHELIRNYVGADRTEEGSPSQESTRFTHHPGTYIVHPRDLTGVIQEEDFRTAAQTNYNSYCNYVRGEALIFQNTHGHEPKGMDRKRIYEAAAGLLLMSCATSFLWTTNPMALAKFFHERDDEAADLEMCRFARALKKVCLKEWPNLFPMVER